MRRIVFAITGASGMPLARTVFTLFRSLEDLEVHLIISRAAGQTFESEGQEHLRHILKIAPFTYEPENFAAPMASGSWRHDGMVVCPCSMSSLAAVALGCGTNLVHRACDVTLKERKPLILVTRETPYNIIHIENMLAATRAGAVIMPFSPVFYSGFTSLEENMLHFGGRILDLLGIRHNSCVRWQGGGC